MIINELFFNDFGTVWNIFYFTNFPLILLYHYTATMTTSQLRHIHALPATQKFLNKPYNSEAELQSAAFIWINATFPPIRHFFLHVPNEQATSDLMRLKMASFGVLSGVPDFCFILPTFWALELKHGNNGLSPKQKALHTLWQQHGIDVFVAHSAHQVVSIVTGQLGAMIQETTTNNTKI